MSGNESLALSVAPWTHEAPAVGPTRVAAHSSLADPMLAYLGSLSPKGRQTMLERLRAVAKLLEVPYEAVVWHELRFVHVELIRHLPGAHPGQLGHRAGPASTRQGPPPPAEPPTGPRHPPGHTHD